MFLELQRNMIAIDGGALRAYLSKLTIGILFRAVSSLKDLSFRS